MNISKKVLAVAILVAVSSTAMAAEKSNEVSIFGSIINQTSPSPSSTTTIVNASYGRYLTDRLLITGSAFVMNNTAVKMTTVGVGAKYYFMTGKKGDFVPFVSGSLNVGTIESTSTIPTYNGFGIQTGTRTSTSTGATFGIRAGGGASYFVSETASIDARLELVAGTMTIGGISSSTQSTELTVGITQRF